MRHNQRGGNVTLQNIAQRMVEETMQYPERARSEREK